MQLPQTAVSEPRISVVLLLHPQQAAWLRNHAGRRGVSAYMRRLLSQLIEHERQEIEQVQHRLALGQGSRRPQPHGS
jgi:hypothetical protein